MKKQQIWENPLENKSEYSITLYNESVVTGILFESVQRASLIRKQEALKEESP